MSSPVFISARFWFRVLSLLPLSELLVWLVSPLGLNGHLMRLLFVVRSLTRLCLGGFLQLVIMRQRLLIFVTETEITLFFIRMTTLWRWVIGLSVPLMYVV